MSIFTKTRSEITSTGGKYRPSEGAHTAIVVGMVDKGVVEKIGEDGSTYSDNDIEMIFAVNESDSNGNSMLVTKQMALKISAATTTNKSAMSKMIEGTRWNWSDNDPLTDLMGKTTQLVIKDKTSKKGNVYSQIDTYIAYDGEVTLTGTPELPYWYQEDMDKGNILLSDGIIIGTKKEKKEKNGDRPEPAEITDPTDIF